MYDPYAEFSKHILLNGLEVHCAFWERPWIAVEIIVHSGGREDPVAMPGLAHFVEHVVSENIPHYDLDQVREFFETCGGQVGFGSTNYLSTRYRFTIPADFEILRDALTIFGFMLLGARIEKDVERERSVILREFNGQYPFREKMEWDMGIRKALFKGHRLETWNRPLGRPEGFLSTTKADLQCFYDSYYTPANISLVIIGGLSTKHVINKLERSPFGIQKNGKRNPIPPTFNQIQIPLDRSRIVKLSDYVNFTVDQTEYRATWAFPSNFSHQARRVFSQMLNKILFDEIREKRALAYGIGTNHVGFQDVCEYTISGKVNPNATSLIDELVNECIELIPFRHDLFERKLKSLKQRCLMIDLAGQSLADNSANDMVSDHRIISIQEVRDELNKVTFEQMIEATKILSRERKYTLITYP